MVRRRATHAVVVLLSCLLIALPAGADPQIQTEAGPAWAEATVSSVEETFAEAGQLVGGDPLALCEVAGVLDVEGMELAKAYGFLRERLDQLLEAADADATFGFLLCDSDDGEVTWFVWAIAHGLPPGLGAVLARSARALVRVPAIGLESSPDGWDVPHLTQLPAWLWVDDVGWSTQTSTASLEVFGASATVTAEPVTSSWFVDDVAVAECGRGERWQPGLDDSTSTCSVTFGEPFEGELSVTVTYDVTLTCVPASLCSGLTLAPIRGAASQPIRAVEAWGVVTSGDR